MNFWEKLVLSLITAAETTVPIFVHSAHGIAILNATEPIVNNFAQALATPPPAPAQPVTPPAA